MKEVVFLSRKEFKKLLKSDIDNINFISVNDTHKETVDMNLFINRRINKGKHLKGTFLQFDDISHDTSGFVMFNSDLAKRTLDFLSLARYNDNPLVVHCFAGVSRSAAIAKFAHDYFNYINHVVDNYTLYNKVVYSTLVKQFYEEQGYE